MLLFRVKGREIVEKSCLGVLCCEDKKMMYVNIFWEVSNWWFLIKMGWERVGSWGGIGDR